MTNPTTYSCQIVKASNANATGMDPIAIARPRSATIRIGRRRRRSTQTPAGKLNRMNGRNSIVVSRPNWNGVTLRVVAAMIGRASWVIAEPKTETVSAVQSLRKSGCRSKLPREAVIARSLPIGFA